jgi:Uma2 family endonuclease
MVEKSPIEEQTGTVMPSTWTVEDYEYLPDNGIRYEILDGELAMTPAPIADHQRLSRRLQYFLMQALEETGRAEVFDAPFDVQLDDTTIVQPDLVIVLAEHADQVSSRRLVGPPDVAVEILLTGTARHDRDTKMKLYLRFGKPWYWIVDPERQQLFEYRIENDRYVMAKALEATESFRPLPFTDVEIPLSRVFLSFRK